MPMFNGSPRKFALARGSLRAVLFYVILFPILPPGRRLIKKLNFVLATETAVTELPKKNVIFHRTPPLLPFHA